MSEGSDQQTPSGAQAAGAEVLERPDTPLAAEETPADTPLSPPQDDAAPAIAPETEASVAPEPAAPELPEPQPAAEPPKPPASVAPPFRLPSRRNDYLLFATARLAETLLLIAVAAGLVWLLLPGSGATPPSDLADRLAVTLPLVLLSLVAATVIGLPLGLLALMLGRRGALLGGGYALLAGLSPLVLGLCGLLVLAGLLALVPPGGFVPWGQDAGAAFVSLTLPVLSLALPLAFVLAAAIWRGGRAPLETGVIERSAAFGLSRSAALSQLVLPPALVSAAAQLAVPILVLPAFAMAIEAAFYLPGLSRALLEALAARDATALRLPLVSLIALGACCRFGLDLVRGALDPELTDRR